MVSISREWTASGRRRLRALGRLQTPVLCVAAALFGAALSAAVLVGYWGDQVQGKRTAQAKLADSRAEVNASRAEVKALTAQNARLHAGLVASRAASARLERNFARIRIETKALTTQNAALVASAGTLH